MKLLDIDEKWSIEYDETNNDKPIYLRRYDLRVQRLDDWDNSTTAMFYALLEERTG